MIKKNRNLRELKEFAKTYKSNERKPKDSRNLLNTIDGIGDVTKAACIRPDIYLDNGRHCEGCPYFEHCKSKIRRLNTRTRY